MAKAALHNGQTKRWPTLRGLARCLTRCRLPYRGYTAQSKTDERIATYSKAVAAQPGSAHLQSLLARAYIQKMRETVDFSYLDRASSLVESVLVRDPGNYEALRLRSEIDMERHEFARVAEYSQEMTRYAPDDPANWGSLGDASMELGRYDAAREAYTKMLALRPDLASYNRIAWYQFVNGHVDEAIALMKNAIAADSPAAENVAWCWNDLGNIYFKTGHLDRGRGGVFARRWRCFRLLSRLCRDGPRARRAKALERGDRRFSSRPGDRSHAGVRRRARGSVRASPEIQWRAASSGNCWTRSTA